MSAENRELHLVFGPSAAGSLRVAFLDAGIKAKVLSPLDDFGFGPIADDDSATRADWVADWLGYSDWADIHQDSLAVREAISADARCPIVWLSPDRASSVAGFLWWLSEYGDRECSLIEAPELNLMHPDQLLALRGQARPLTAAKRSASMARWTALKRENAPLRVLGQDGLVSAPIDFFDAALLRNVDTQWRKIGRIVGNTLQDFLSDQFDQTGDLLLLARLAHLAEAGVLEWRGDLGAMRFCEVRLAC